MGVTPGVKVISALHQRDYLIQPTIKHPDPEKTTDEYHSRSVCQNHPALHSPPPPPLSPPGKNTDRNDWGWLNTEASACCYLSRAIERPHVCCCVGGVRQTGPPALTGSLCGLRAAQASSRALRDSGSVSRHPPGILLICQVGN